MKFKILLIVLFTVNYCFSQSDIYYFKDVNSDLTLNEVKQKKFTHLHKQVLEKHSNATYWFLIPSYETNLKYVFRVAYDRFNKANAYQESKRIYKSPNNRFLSYKFTRDKDVYIQIKPKFHSYIPVTVKTEKESLAREKNELLFNGFYYGFAFLIILYSLFYYFLFKDIVFLYYSMFQLSISFGIFTMDGMLNFFKVDENVNEFIMVVNYISLAYFSSKFINNYLFIETYFPKIKKYAYVIGSVIILMGILYLTLESYYYLFVLNILVFSLTVIYWLTSLFLFNKNVYTKILVLANSVILFSSIDFFVLKFLGVSLININSLNIKIGSFFEMIFLTIAVLYRMNILITENNFMKDEIIKFSKEIESLSANNEYSSSKENSENSENLENLSNREREIFDLIVLGKSNKIIADELNVSINTIKFHIKNIYEKLNIKNRKEAVRLEKSLS
ncbi:LuxR C-terminal-related transcriptional regulator [Polaribacter sp. Asnod1-A03]|uniref:LuxR C-terminal-related transcriptional regulator n=1 Tax=Polaribacter sp. Asnod1-A03 TaxID=3160581 RepID=UPI00386E4960